MRVWMLKWFDLKLRFFAGQKNNDALDGDRDSKGDEGGKRIDTETLDDRDFHGR
jgi:hypothetical protein